MKLHRSKYQILLDKFKGDTELIELIEECILEDKGEREAIYIRRKEYPEQRDLLMKLKTDLLINMNKES